MKIGIVTFWKSKDNFGQILQCYALQTILKKMGHEPILIRTEASQANLSFKLKLKSKLRKLISLEKLNYGGINFDKFLENHILFTEKIYHSKSDFTPSELNYDAIICGSDVVWSEGVGTGDWGKLCFLDFVTAPIKKISYAASFGASELSGKFSDFIKPMVNSFDSISVREESGVDICAKLGRPDAVTVCDPTMLLRKDDYETLLAQSKTDCKSAFAYFIGWDTDIPEREIKRYVKEKKWTYSRLDCQNHKKSFKQLFVKSKSIPEWLRAYRGAYCVFTNSFHGIIFALIFNKPFLFFPLKGTAQKLNNRVENILGKIGLLNRIWDSNKNIMDQMDEPIDWLQVNETVEEFRCFSLNWLKNALES